VNINKIPILFEFELTSLKIVTASVRIIENNTYFAKYTDALPNLFYSSSFTYFVFTQELFYKALLMYAIKTDNKISNVDEFFLVALIINYGCWFYIV
jgi:hypothetical protein